MKIYLNRKYDIVTETDISQLFIILSNFNSTFLAVLNLYVKGIIFRERYQLHIFTFFMNF